ncbi:hypothetical protein GCM10007862_28600 [Dyella lipolytica]|uniref:Uncharacterized protein n=1 Tax=Dyella lipolytica TaxID=1867835 RepID=A0ABW8IX31_9GAMM|nr:hypothetical protein [Dyella lipolytica]GLQ47809.1 hypothetical protein GCM10007862_28600 [Dyella lipolytica]
METICEACGYQRKPTDQAPDWQCPSCGKAYAKTSHHSQGSFSGYAQSSVSESGNRLDEVPAYQQQPSDSAYSETEKTSTKYAWVFGAVFGIFVIWGIPILSNPSSASAILLHGDVGFVCIALLAIMGVVVVTRRLSAKVDLNDPMSKFAFFAKFLALFCTVFFVLMAIWLRNQERTEVKIQLNGQRAMADVVRIYTGSCGKRSCSINVEYAFTPTSETSGVSQPIHGYAQLGTSNRPNDPDVVYAKTNQHVPIAYEVDHPQVSALNFNDDVFRIDHGEQYRRTLALFGEIFLGIFLIGLAAGGLSYWLNSGKQPNPD